MEANDIALAQQRFQIDHLNTRNGSRVHIRVIGQHLHAKGLGHSGRSTTNTPNAHNTHRQADQFDEGIVPIAKVRALSPASFADRLGVIGDLLGQVQQVCKGVLSNRARGVRRNVRHRDTPFAGCCDVHMIIAGCQCSDVP